MLRAEVDRSQEASVQSLAMTMSSEEVQKIGSLSDLTIGTSKPIF